MAATRPVLVSIVLALSLTVPAVAQQSAPTMGRSVAKLAGVKIRTRAGASVPLGSQIKPGKPTLISVFATWCLPCVEEAPFLNRIRHDLGDSVNFVYVNRSDGIPDPDQPPALITQYLARAGMSDVDYVTVDLKGYRQIVGADMATIPDGMVGIPRVYLFDRNGKQIYTRLGFRISDGIDLEQRTRQASGK